MKHFFSRSGFTLVELIIAILISMMVLSGMAFFFVKISAEIQLADNKTKVYLELSDFIQQADSFTREFPRGIIFTGASDTPGTPTYQALIFSNSGNTRGAIIGVVSSPDNGKTWKLDRNHDIYGEKRLMVSELTSNQMSMAWTGIVFPDDRTFPYLIMRDLTVDAYNSGSIFDVNMGVYSLFDPSNIGKNIHDIKIQKNTDIISTNLVF